MNANVDTKDKKLHGRSCPSSIMPKGINLSLRLTIKNYRTIFLSVRFAKMKDEGKNESNLYL